MSRKNNKIELDLETWLRTAGFQLELARAVVTGLKKHKGGISHLMRLAKEPVLLDSVMDLLVPDTADPPGLEIIFPYHGHLQPLDVVEKYARGFTHEQGHSLLFETFSVELDRVFAGLGFKDSKPISRMMIKRFARSMENTTAISLMQARGWWPATHYELEKARNIILGRIDYRRVIAPGSHIVASLGRIVPVLDYSKDGIKMTHVLYDAPCIDQDCHLFIQ